VAHAHNVQGERIGVLALEESVERTARGFMGLALGKRIDIDSSGVSQEDLKGAFTATVGSGRCFLYDHFGSLDTDVLLGKIRYMVVGCSCSTILLDHLSIVVSGSELDDERKAIDVVLTKLKSMAMELNFRLFVVVHVRRVENTNHEEGSQLSLSHLRGSGSIAQLSNIVIGLERNLQDEETKDITTIRVLKNRFTGETGVAGYLKYDKASGRFTECGKPKKAEVSDAF
jgi:twinkle protein